MNPMDMLKNLFGSGSNPQQFLMQQLIGSTNNPMLNNLIKMAQNGNSQSVEQFARNFCKERGKDFDKEFNNFMSQLKR